MTLLNKQEALAQIASLIDDFDIDMADIEQILARKFGNADTQSSTLVKVLSYLGGTFIFAGIVTFIALQWDAMNSAARVIVTLGSGLCFFVLGVFALRDTRYRQISMPLFIAASLLQPLGLMVAFDEFLDGGDEKIAWLVTLGVFGLQFIAAFLRWRLTTLAMISLGFLSGFWAVLLDLCSFDEKVIAVTLGAMWLVAAVGLRKGTHAAATPLLFFFGCWMLLIGWWSTVEGSIFEVGFLFAACGLVWVGVWAQSRALNFAATLGILGYTAYFTGHYFADSIGWPLALMAIGFALIGISVAALRIDRKYLRA
ncbi:MAG: DUF2157 domain-containing protein [Gammaproteobacteria bacterium]|nr:DUF2157 domain-containing protein [Gammaproteobacteria bacterium]